MHLNKLNENINLEAIPAKIPTQIEPWQQHKDSRIAAISSFGISGTIAHMIVEEAPKVMVSDAAQGPYALLLSAKTEAGVADYEHQLLGFLTSHADVNMADVAYTLALGRSHYPMRRVIMKGEVRPELQRAADEWLAGDDVNWAPFFEGQRRNKIALPTYAFQRQRYWSQMAKATTGRMLTAIHPLLGEKHTKPNGEIHYVGGLNLSQLDYLQDHQVFDTLIYPGAGYIEMLLASAMHALGEGVIHLQELSIDAALALKAGAPVETQVIMTPQGQGHYEVAIYSQAGVEEDKDAKWHCHARGTVFVDADADAIKPAAMAIDALKARCSETINPKTFYKTAGDLGLGYGPAFQTIQSLSVNDKEIMAELSFAKSTKGYCAHPALLDGCLQLLLAVKEPRLALPIGCDEIQWFAPLEEQVIAHCQLSDASSDEGMIADITIANQSGEILGLLHHLHCRRTTKKALKQMISDSPRVADWLYEWTWEESELIDIKKPKTEGRWIVFADDSAITINLVKAFEEKGAKIETINVANLPRSTSAYMDILNHAIKTGKLSGVIHATSLMSDATATALTKSSLEAEQTIGIQSVLHLTQAIMQLQEQAVIPLRILTLDTLAQSTIAGFIKTLKLEQAQFPVKHITLALQQDSPELAAMMLNEIATHDNEVEIYIKDAKRWVGRLTRLKVDAHLAMDFDTQIQSNSAYLISGGLGGLGLSLAHWLAEHGAGEIMLTGRSELSDGIREKLTSLKNTGVIVNYQQVDISDEQAVDTLIANIQKGDKPLKGIFHLAGVLDDATLLEQDWQHFEKTFAPKVYGSFNLHHSAIKHQLALDYFTLFSSMASTMGSPGQSNYAAANSFMDALAHYRQQQGLVGQSLSWGPWAEVGMAKELVARHARSGLMAMNPEEGLHAMEYALQAKYAHVSLMNLRWPQYLKQLMASPSWLAHFSQSMTAKKSLAEQLNSIAPTEQTTFVHQFVEDTVKAILGLSKGQTIDEQKGFFDMGMDSLMVVELRNRLQAGLGQAARLGTTAVFDHASIHKITHYLCNLLNIDIEKETTEIESLDEKIAKQSSEEVEKLGDQEVLDELFKAIDDEE